jgi:hypothetical protein
VALDLTPVLTALIGATGTGVGGWIGYLTSKRGSSVELRRIEAENERLREQHREDHSRHRQAVYHDFLDTAHRFHQDMVGTEKMTRDEKREWLRVFEHRTNAVLLFGAQSASEAARGLYDAMGDLMAAKGYRGEEDERKFVTAYYAAVDAMRLDTAPERPPAPP